MGDNFFWAEHGSDECPLHPRMSLLETSLQIRGVTEADAGEYYCNVETYGAPLDQVGFGVPKLKYFSF